MPNAKFNNWVSFCAAIDGFRSRYKSWPKSVKVPKHFLYELERLLSEDELFLLASKIRIIEDDSTYIALDEAGNSYNYGDEGFSDETPEVRAQDWLDATTDYYD